MSTVMDQIIKKAKQLNKHIVLPEGEEPRIIAAAELINAMGIAKLTLLGREEIIRNIANPNSLNGVEIIDSFNNENLEEFTEILFQLRKDKGLTYTKAQELAKSPLYYGCLMVKSRKADGMVAGTINSTGDVLRPALQIIKSKTGIKTVSSFFLMSLPQGSHLGENGVMIFSDCAVIPEPTSEQLVDIAISSAESAFLIAGIKDVNVALLSFSTKGSASHPLVEKVVKATKILKKMGLGFELDGELQLDAALIPEVAKIKAKESTVAGYANVLIFPDLQSGNIGYKIAERIGRAEAIGPICQGLAAPVNDLSRGCNVGDIVGAVAITALQAT